MLYRVALGEVMREIRLGQRKTMRQVSGEACMALGYLSEIERGQKELSSEFLPEIARALGVTEYQLVIEAGFKMAHLSIPDTIEDLLSDNLTLS